MIELTRYLISATAAEALLCLGLTFLFASLYRRSGEVYLYHWTLGFGALAIHTVSGALDIGLSTSHLPTSPLRVLTAQLALVTALWSGAWIFFGAMLFGRKDDLPLRTQHLVLLALAAGGVALSFGSMALPAERLLAIKIGLPSAWLALAGLISAISVARAIPRVGRGNALLVSGFAIWGLSQTHLALVFTGTVITTVTPTHIAASFLAGLSGLGLVGFGILIRQLDAERGQPERTTVPISPAMKQRITDGIARDFTTVIRELLGTVSNLRNNLPQEANAQGLVDEIESRGKEVVDLADQLTSLGDQKNPGKTVVHLVDVVTGLRTVLDRSPHAALRVRLQSDCHLDPVILEHGALERLLLALCLAARRHAQQPAIINIKCDNVDLSSPESEFDAPVNDWNVKPGRYISLSLPVAKRRVLDGYRRDREFALDMASKIVRRAGGAVHSEPGDNGDDIVSILLPSPRGMTIERFAHAT